MVLPPTYGGRLCAARTARGLTLKAVANQVKCSTPYLSDLENGHREPQSYTPVIQRLEALLDVAPDPPFAERLRAVLGVGTEVDVLEYVRTLNDAASHFFNCYDCSVGPYCNEGEHLAVALGFMRAEDISHDHR